MRYSINSDLLEINKKATFTCIDEYPIHDVDYKWVGGVLASDGNIYAIPNKSSQILTITPKDNSFCLWGSLPVGPMKKWTGGCYWNGFVYGFPRGANSLLKIDYLNKTTEIIDLPISYSSDHHYGGAVTPEGVLYQPPRDGKTILRIDLNNYQVREIVLPKRFAKKSYLYYGGIYHVSGKVYFFPRGRFQKVLYIDVKSEELSYCTGLLAHVSATSAALAPNGMIYAYNSYTKGILKIDPETNYASIIHQHLPGGYFGTKLGFNGKLYSIPGSSSSIMEMDPATECVRKCAEVIHETNVPAKCAGGAIDTYGNIWCIPAQGNYIRCLRFCDIASVKASDLYSSGLFASCY